MILVDTSVWVDHLRQALPRAVVASETEVLGFTEGRKLMGRGIGYVDAHLLASATLTQVRLWTRDRRLAAAGSALNLSFTEAM